MSKRIEELIAKSRPGLADKAYNGAMAAIRLFCICCMGGSSADVAKCGDSVCSLYRFRTGKRPIKRPTKAQAAEFEKLALNAMDDLGLEGREWMPTEDA